jgi:hypothetical protein
VTCLTDIPFSSRSLRSSVPSSRRRTVGLPSATLVAFFHISHSMSAGGRQNLDQLQLTPINTPAGPVVLLSLPGQVVLLNPAGGRWSR